MTDPLAGLDEFVVAMHRTLAEHGPLTRLELARALGVGKGYVVGTVHALIRRRLVRQQEPDERGARRLVAVPPDLAAKLARDDRRAEAIDRRTTARRVAALAAEMEQQELAEVAEIHHEEIENG